MPGLWAGVYGLSLLCPRCGLLLLGWCACYPVSGGLVCVLFLVSPVCGLVLFGWVACWHMLDVLGCCPSPIFRGGAVRFSVSLGALASCIVCGALPFWK